MLQIKKTCFCKKTYEQANENSLNNFVFKNLNHL
jgi:hypothetical protein